MSILLKRFLAALMAGSALIGIFALPSFALAESKGRSESGEIERSHRSATSTNPVNPEGMTKGWAKDGENKGASLFPLITGNGLPIIGGNVTAVSSTSLTVANKNVTYAVSIASTTIAKKGVTNATLSNIAVGDAVIVQGTVNGTSIAASTIIDQGITASTTAKHQGGGFFSKMGGFFSRFFRF